MKIIYTTFFIFLSFFSSSSVFAGEDGWKQLTIAEMQKFVEANPIRVGMFHEHEYHLTWTKGYKRQVILWNGHETKRKVNWKKGKKTAEYAVKERDEWTYRSIHVNSDGTKYRVITKNNGRVEEFDLPKI